MRCYRRLLNISYKDRVTSEEVHRKIQAAMRQEKLRWFGYVTRSSGLAKTILQEEEEVDRRRDGKTILKSGQQRTLSAQLGLLLYCCFTSTVNI